QRERYRITGITMVNAIILPFQPCRHQFSDPKPKVTEYWVVPTHIVESTDSNTNLGSKHNGLTSGQVESQGKPMRKNKSAERFMTYNSSHNSGL
ncbi:hypothetical protein STEG23_025511, partial [Scotinomys teguina]